MIAVVWLLVATLAAAGLARAALRRRWRLHAVVACVCALILAVHAAFAAFGDVAASLPGWVNGLGISVDVLLVAVMVDLSRAGKREGASTEATR